MRDVTNIMIRLGSDVNDLIILLKENRFWIYGAGFVANIFWQNLAPYDVYGNAEGFIVSKKDCDFFNKLNVKEISENVCGKDDLICIAVHESIIEDVIKEIEDKGLFDYIAIYPYLWDLRIGAPQKKGVKISVNNLISKNLSDFKIVVRYLALEQYFKKNEIGYDLYIKAFTTHVDKKTAIRRLERYIDFISQWESKGYIPNTNIKINRKGQIIDGHHRTVLAKYFGLKTLDCDIYDTNMSAEDVYGNRAAMTEEIMKQVFDVKEIKMLEQCREKLILNNKFE